MGRIKLVAMMVAVVGTAHAAPPAKDMTSDQPAIAGGASAGLRWRLGVAHGLALDRLRRLPACRALFSELGSDGVEVVGGTVYHVATTDRELRTCSERSAAAFTTVGGGQVWLCPTRFTGMLRFEAAALILHEALHDAGMTEAPSTPDAPTSRQIATRVATACGL